MHADWALPILIAVPALLAGICLCAASARAAVLLCAGGTLAVGGYAAALVARVFRNGPLGGAGGWLRLDALSAYHLAVMALVFVLSALYGLMYFGEEMKSGALTRRLARRYGGLWFGSMAAMILVLSSNNLGVMWVGIEATTLLTAFLICVHATPGALEAMWKYLLMCSVGVAVAFIGILLIAASTAPAGIPAADALLWTRLRDAATTLDPVLLKAGFVFIVVGCGTKAGLAPMHNWLPDAHSQAPAPVSAIFSGFLLNAALYGILRCLPIVEAATGQTGWGGGILVALGLLSVVVAAAFIAAQHDLKRLLAYSSVEHIGVIALGAGLGGVGALGALFHMLNHSVCKSMAFFCAGRLGQTYGTHDMRRLARVLSVSPVWGGGLVCALLAIIGMAPFALFLSEFLVLKAAVDRGRYGVAALLLSGLAVVFVGALRNGIAMAWDPLAERVRPRRPRFLEAVFVCVPLAGLLVLGLWTPRVLLDVLAQAAALLGDAP